jgi:hypothetical protein
MVVEEVRVRLGVPVGDGVLLRVALGVPLLEDVPLVLAVDEPVPDGVPVRLGVGVLVMLGDGEGQKLRRLQLSYATPYPPPPR